MSSDISPKKRGICEESDVDALYEQVCTQLQRQSIQPEQSSLDYAALVQAYTSVMSCMEEEALFFLESANWDIAMVRSIHV